MQCAYFSACTLEHILLVVVGDSQPFLKRWQKLRETVFQALVFPTGLVSSLLFSSLSFSFPVTFLTYLGYVVGAKYQTYVWKSSDQKPCLIWVKIYCTFTPAHRPYLLLLSLWPQPVQGRAQVEGAAAGLQAPHIQILKHIFCWRDDIKLCTRFALHPKPSTEIGW